MKRTLTILTAALFAGALAAPVLYTGNAIAASTSTTSEHKTEKKAEHKTEKKSTHHAKHGTKHHAEHHSKHHMKKTTKKTETEKK